MNIPLDKQAHILGGYALAATSGLSVSHSFPILMAALAGATVAAVAGALKELYDHLHPTEHTCDIFDFVATVCGGIAGAVFIYFMA